MNNHFIVIPGMTQGADQTRVQTGGGNGVQVKCCANPQKTVRGEKGKGKREGSIVVGPLGNSERGGEGGDKIKRYISEISLNGSFFSTDKRGGRGGGKTRGHGGHIQGPNQQGVREKNKKRGKQNRSTEKKKKKFGHSNVSFYSAKGSGDRLTYGFVAE